VGYFIDLLFLFVRRPAEGMRRIRERPSVLAALIALLLTGVIDAMSFRLMDIVGLLKSIGLTSQMTDAVTQAQQAPGTFWTFVTEPFVLVMLSVVVIDAVAQLVWKRTAASRMYVALSFSGLVGAVLRVIGILMVVSQVVSFSTSSPTEPSCMCSSWESWRSGSSMRRAR